MEITNRENVHKGGFAGIREHRMVMDTELFGGAEPGSKPKGIGKFVYLADAEFIPNGQTGMHPHKEVDVISVMVRGRVAHQGSLENGSEIKTRSVQIQRAGGEGFSHNEVNPDPVQSRMLQLWFLPEVLGQPASYKLFDLKEGEVTRVYGGDGKDTYEAKTLMDVGLFKDGQDFKVDGEFIAYVTEGSGEINEKPVVEGDLISGKGMDFKASGECFLVVISV